MKIMKEKINRDVWQPERLKGNVKKRILSLKKKGVNVIDQYPVMVEEVFLLRNPRFRFDKNYAAAYESFLKIHHLDRDSIAAGTWFYYSWQNAVIHFLPDDMHQELRTSRNKFLITQQEQRKFYNAKIGILGMSVGSHVALTIAMTGGAKHIKLADPDIVSGSNLNRIRTGFHSIGLNKTVLTARQIMEINPYAEVELYKKGIDDGNINKFMLQPKLDLLVEELDNPYFKLKARFIARSNGIPVVMAADNSDGVIVDVERFDLNRKLPILHGILGKITPDQLKQIAPRDLPKVIAKIAGANIANIRMLDSVLQVGKTIYSWPQLGTAATLCGTILAGIARKIINKDKVSNGRFNIDPEVLFIQGYNSRAHKRARQSKRKRYLKAMGIV